MALSPAERHPLEVLADEFASRCRRGECPSIPEFMADHPEHARQIEHLFPAIAMLERLRIEEAAGREAAMERVKPRSRCKRVTDRGGRGR